MKDTGCAERRGPIVRSYWVSGIRPFSAFRPRDAIPVSRVRPKGLYTTYRVKHLDGNVDVGGLARDGNEAFLGVGRDIGRDARSRIGDPDLAPRVLAHLVDLGSALTNDYGALGLSTAEPRVDSLAPTKALGMKICCVCAPGM